MKPDDVSPATASQTVGPFFHIGLSACSHGRLADRLPGVERVHVMFRVTDGDGNPVEDALVELWQSGPMESAENDGSHAGAALFGRMATDRDGVCEFETVWPETRGGAAGGSGAAHINVCLFARGLLRHLHTRIYFAGDPAVEHDAALALVPEDRRATLMATPDATRPGRWLFNLRLQGAGETVFFDA
jgi:protocatechuate 3,4-dioxygenase alpha subunit